LVLAGAVVCVALGRFAEDHFGRKDPSQVTADEWAGQALALIGLPAATAPGGLLIVAAAAFVAFRIFDIIKPPPAYGLQRLPEGWGILVDDLVAGVYANVAAQAILRLVVPALGASLSA
jgi:phosphatidylglycerophosphatase A